jgi:cytochrome b561
MSMSGGHPVNFFGLAMPSLMDKNPDVKDIAWKIHQVLSYALIAGVALHVLGAFKHHIIDKDNTLTRMVLGPQRFFIIVIFIVLFVFIGGLFRVLVF